MPNPYEQTSSLERLAIDSLFRDQPDLFEAKLYQGLVDSRGDRGGTAEGQTPKAELANIVGKWANNLNNSQKTLRYPYDLLTSPHFQTFMKIDIYDPDHASARTRRTEHKAEEASKSFKGVIKNFIRGAQQAGLFGLTGGTGAETPQDQVSIADSLINKTVQAGVTVVGPVLDSVSNFMTARGGPRSNYTLGINDPISNHHRPSWVEEETGIARYPMTWRGTICLYIPTGLDFSYGLEYEDANMSGFDVLKLGYAAANKDIDPKYSSEIAKKLGFANLKVMNALTDKIPGFSGEWDKFVSAQTKQVVNPMSLHLFKEVKRREFTFPYTFLPRSYEETIQVMKIINAFKFFAHPERSANGRFLDYPAEFKIHFVENNGRPNFYLPSIQKCVLKGVKVKYGDDASFSTFQRDGDYYGSAPTKITMELTFGELEILTRERFANPYLKNSWGA